jgi:hypothetical protein
MKQVWLRGIGRCSGDKSNVIRWWNKFDQEGMEGAQVIDQMWSGDETSLVRSFISWSHSFYHPRTFHYLLSKLVLSPDHICFVTRASFMTIWSSLFYHLITFVLLPEHLSFPLDQTCFITWSHLFCHPSTFHDLLLSGDKTSLIKW